MCRARSSGACHSADFAGECAHLAAVCSDWTVPAEPDVTPLGMVRVDARTVWAGCAALIAALVLPVVWVLATRDDHNIGDIALIELRVRDVFSAHPPVTGAYSRYGWSHPGPVLFYLLAVPYRVFGNDATGLRVATLILNVAALGALFWLARRRGLAPLVAVATATTLLIWGLQADALSYGWNVTVTLVPFLLTAVACWSVLCGDDVALVVAAVAAVFVFQSHVGAGVVIAPLVLVTAGFVVWRRRRPVLGRGSLIAGGGLLALALVPIAFDTFRDPQGNLATLLKWSLDNDEPKVGVLDGLRMIGRTSSLSFPGSPELPGRFFLQLDTVSVGFLPGAALVLLALATIVARRRGWADEAALCGVVVVLWVSGAVAASTITEPLGWWLVEWLQPLGWLTWAAIALVGWRVVQSRWADVGTGLTVPVLSLAGVVVVSAVVAHALNTVALDDRTAEVVEPVSVLTDAALELGADDEPIRFDFRGSVLTAEPMLSGVVNRLDAVGVEACVDDTLAYKFGSFRVCPSVPLRTLIIRSEPLVSPPPDGATMVVITDPLTDEERREADNLRAIVADVLDANGMGDRVGVLDTSLADTVLLGDPPPELITVADDVRRLDQLREVPGIRYGLYLVPG